MMMGAPEDDARTVNSETGDETESELCPSSPEAMLREAANDATAGIDYVHQFPRAFGQPHVEAAFQAQYTETRLSYVACVFGGNFFFFFCGFMYDLLDAMFQLGPQPPTKLPLSLWLGVCVIFLLLSLGLLCKRKKLRHHHYAVQALSDITFVVLFIASTGVTLAAVLNGGYPSTFSAGYISGLVLAGGASVMAHTEASLWTFLFNVVFAVSLCYALATMSSDAIHVSSNASTIASVVILGSVLWQIKLKHRHEFAAQVRHQLHDTFCSF